MRHKPLCYPYQTVAPPGTESTQTTANTFTVPHLSNSFCFVLLVFFLLLVFLCLGLCLFLVLLLFCYNQEFKISSCQLPGCLRNKAQDAVLTNKTMEEAQAWTRTLPGPTASYVFARLWSFCGYLWSPPKEDTAAQSDQIELNAFRSSARCATKFFSSSSKTTWQQMCPWRALIGLDV